VSCGKEHRIDPGQALEAVLARLRDKKIILDLTGDVESCCSGQGRVKMVCIGPGLGDSVREMGKTARDQVVMVRVDEATSEALDAWVATGAVKSRSEAAALFIREGLKIRADELARLRDSLRELEAAKDRLHRQAMEVLGKDPDQDQGGTSA
jgi:hypothetical protein